MTPTILSNMLSCITCISVFVIVVCGVLAGMWMTFRQDRLMQGKGEFAKPREITHYRDAA